MDYHIEPSHIPGRFHLTIYKCLIKRSDFTTIPNRRVIAFYSDLSINDLAQLLQ